MLFNLINLRLKWTFIPNKSPIEINRSSKRFVLLIIHVPSFYYSMGTQWLDPEYIFISICMHFIDK